MSDPSRWRTAGAPASPHHRTPPAPPRASAAASPASPYATPASSAAAAAPAATSGPSSSTKTAGQAASAPATTPSTTGGGRPSSRRARSGAGTPRLLRVLRTTTAAAAIATGLLASGAVAGSSSDALQDWADAERSVVHMAEADLLAGERVADRDTSVGTQEAFADAAGEVRLVAHYSREPDVTTTWSEALLTAERAATQAAASSPDAATTYRAAHERADEAVRQADDIASRRAEDLSSGPEAVIARVVGGATLALFIVTLVVIALRTRRVINIPLVGGTLLVALILSGGIPGLTSAPSENVDRARELSESLQSVHQARAAIVTTELGLDSGWSSNDARFGRAWISEQLRDDWSTLANSAESAVSGQVSADTAKTDSTEAYQRLSRTLGTQLDTTLSDSRGSAATTFGAGLTMALGAAAGVLAWWGIGQRLREYR